MADLTKDVRSLTGLCLLVDDGFKRTAYPFRAVAASRAFELAVLQFIR